MSGKCVPGQVNSGPDRGLIYGGVKLAVFEDLNGNVLQIYQHDS